MDRARSLFLDEYCIAAGGWPWVGHNMIRMVREINAEFADGNMHVTCYTCHRNSTMQATAP